MGAVNKSLAKKSLQEQADELLFLAEQSGVKTNYFFATTFKRYTVQLKILADLESEISRGDTLVSKEYVKGRCNLYTNPAITEYNKTATAANGTVTTLINIIEKLSKTDSSETLADIMSKIV